ncbi:hypothetical protein PENSUB_80 [Penicillium subrubescens]|uniref:Uncharacterized protein n=1 Tax=Penicillium subrubescens TaxID=1316194 RepID=A0A1Q5UP19_9EURO|nr:hypothetical protein PENSUB_80 [Penicillium subrubescens]
MSCPGPQVARYFPEVSGGSDRDMLAVSDAAHETCHARCTIIPSVKVPIMSVSDASGGVMVVSPYLNIREHAGLSTGVGRAYPGARK